MLPIVSVIIVTFNAGKTLKRSIQSVINQTYPYIDFVIIDGASTDCTLEIIKKYNIKYISEPDKGIYDAMNKGWLIAKGEWILYLGADDELCPDAINNLINESYNNDIVYGDYFIKYLNGQIKYKKAKDYLYIKKTNFTCHQSVMMSKKVFRILGGFNLKYKIIADYDILLRAYLYGFHFKKINKPISIFHIGGLSSYNLKGHFERIACLLTHNMNPHYELLLKFFLVKFKHKYIDKKI